MLVNYRKTGEFEAAKEDLLLAIRDKGLVVDYTSHIGNMLERTGKDVGSATRVYLKAEAFQFCSAVVSRRTMEADPANIGYCPYVIALFVTPFLALVSLFVGPAPMALAFSRLEILSLFLGAIIVAVTSGDGRATWFKGVQLVAVYALFALLAYFVPA